MEVELALGPNATRSELQQTLKAVRGAFVIRQGSVVFALGMSIRSKVSNASVWREFLLLHKEKNTGKEVKLLFLFRNTTLWVLFCSRVDGVWISLSHTHSLNGKGQEK